jgi:EmrB/QacA subfamily drug resistance transporter
MNPGKNYKWTVLSVTTVGGFMSSLDMTITIIGLPTILQSLHATIVHGIWIVTGYTLMQVILLVTLGRLADLYGRVRLYNLGFAVFTIGSLLCALSQNGEQLVIFRLLQGSGAALLTANGTAIITDAFPGNQLGLSLGINMMSFNIGAIAGYTLSGIMITYFGWRSIFFINVPIGVFATIWGYLRLKEIGIKPVGQKFDLPGSILYCVAVLAILVGLTIGTPTSARNIAVMAAGVAVFIAVIFIELRVKFPTLDLSLFKIRAFAAGNIASFLNSLAFSCGPFLRSLYLQLILGYSPLKAGVLLIPMEVVVLISGPISGRLSDKYGSRGLSTLGLALNAAALFWFSQLNERSSYGIVLVSMMLFGLGRALFIPPNVSAVMGSVPAEKRGIANGIRMTLNQTGNVISVPFSLLLMSLVMPYSQLSQIVNSSQLVQPGVMHTFLRAINQSCLILGFVIVAAMIPSFLRGKRESPAS